MATQVSNKISGPQWDWNSADNLHCRPLDNHQCSDAHWRGWCTWDGDTMKLVRRSMSASWLNLSHQPL